MVKVYAKGQYQETPEEIEQRLAANSQYLQMPYQAKVNLARQRIWEWHDTCRENGKKFAVSVGGLDSITLLALCRDELGKDVQGVSVSSLEDKSIQQVHREMGIIPIKPLKSKVQVLQEFGFPIVSKLAAAKIELLQTPNSEKQTFIHAIMTGDMGEQGKFQHSEKIKLPDKWLRLFGGCYQQHRPDLICRNAPFKVSDKCCLYLKEKPMHQYQKERNIWPFLGLMQSEGGRRELALKKYGCNYIGKDTARSCPFNYFNRQDILQLALDLKIHVPEIYGEIVREPDGTLRTTKAQRTGCSMCGFGIHLDRRPHHFDLLREQNPQEWEFWMYRCYTDPDTGEKYGWGRVLTYIGVGWENDYRTDLVGQISMFDRLEDTE